MKNNVKLSAVVLAALTMASGIIFLAGCKPETPVELVDRIHSKSSVVTIDNCQYIFMESGFTGGNNYAFSLTHKGNCTNHIHTYNK